MGFPETMLEGEIYGEASIVITNRSAPVLTKCSVACSHPAYVSARDKRVVSTRAFPNGLAQEQALPVTLPSGGLATGASAILPVLLRGDTAGDTSLCFAFAYSHDVPEVSDSSRPRCRLLTSPLQAKQQTFMHQASVALTTLPSLVLEPAIEPVMTNNEVASYELSLRVSDRAVPLRTARSLVSSACQPVFRRRCSSRRGSGCQPIVGARAPRHHPRTVSANWIPGGAAKLTNRVPQCRLRPVVGDAVVVIRTTIAATEPRRRRWNGPNRPGTSGLPQERRSRQARAADGTAIDHRRPTRASVLGAPALASC